MGTGEGARALRVNPDEPRAQLGESHPRASGGATRAHPPPRSLSKRCAGKITADRTKYCTLAARDGAVANIEGAGNLTLAPHHEEPRSPLGLRWPTASLRATAPPPGLIDLATGSFCNCTSYHPTALGKTCTSMDAAMEPRDQRRLHVYTAVAARKGLMCAKLYTVPWDDLLWFSSSRRSAESFARTSYMLLSVHTYFL
jgi:hypothetical protein